MQPDGPYEVRVDSGAPPVTTPPIPAPLFEAEMTLTVTPDTALAAIDVPPMAAQATGFVDISPTSDATPCRRRRPGQDVR